MSKMSKEHLVNFLQTTAGETAMREASKLVSEEIISAAKYYMGVPDGNYFEAAYIEEEAVKAKKAYVTLNTIMGGDTAEMDRFNEGKKQTPELLTPYGVKKMVTLFTHLFCFASGNKEAVKYETVRACRQTEVSEGESVVGPLTSTTKLSVDEIMKLGYGNKNGLAICRYKFHDGVAIFDMEELGKNYLKPEEREVLLLMGNKLIARCSGYDDRYLGKDGQPALMYDIDVYPPKIVTSGNQTELEKVVYNPDTIKEVKGFYKELNAGGDFPEIPACYPEWKEAFKKLVFEEISKLIA